MEKNPIPLFQGDLIVSINYPATCKKQRPLFPVSVINDWCHHSANRTFARWRKLTATTRIHLNSFFPLLLKFGNPCKV